MELVKNAILSGIFNDLGSGSNVDVMVLRHVRRLLFCFYPGCLQSVIFCFIYVIICQLNALRVER